MLGGDGDDTMVWNNGDGSDLMEGQAGNDTTEVNGAATDGDAFTVNPNGNRVRFDRTNLIPFTLDIGTTERLAVNGGGGDDSATGAAGLKGLIALAFVGQDANDVLTGGDGDDVLDGGRRQVARHAARRLGQGRAQGSGRRRSAQGPGRKGLAVRRWGRRPPRLAGPAA